MWYLIYHQERKFSGITRQLKLLKINYLSPFFVRFAKRVDRKSYRVLAPKQVFPGYIFINLDLSFAHADRIKKIDGVIGFVNFGGVPYLLSEKQVSEIKSFSLRFHSIENNGSAHCKDGFFSAGNEKTSDLLLSIAGENDPLIKERRFYNEWLSLDKNHKGLSA